MLPSDNPDNVLQVDEEKVSLLPHTHMTHLREYLNSSLLQDRHALRFPKSLHPETGNKGIAGRSFIFDLQSKHNCMLI